MQVCFFSDTKAINFNPLTHTRPLDDLRIGIFSIRRKWEYWLDINDSNRILDNHLYPVFSKGEIDDSKDVIWINSRVLPNRELTDAVKNLKAGEALSYNKDLIAIRLDGTQSHKYHQSNAFDAEQFVPDSKDFPKAITIENIWDLLKINAFEISKDIYLTKLEEVQTGKFEQTSFSGEKNIYIANDVVIEPGCIIIADEGPVVIMNGAKLEAGAILRGPVAVCEGSTIKTGARISGGTTIGPVCKVGGEVSGCIFHSYSNKAHEGFTGDSIFGQWVNLGADTNTSNLKNNYGTVKLRHWESGQEVETGKQFLGTIMADHSKTAINTMLNTGTICGVSSNIFMNGFPPKYIPSFSWVGSADIQTYRFDKAMETMAAMMERRGKGVGPAYRNMMQHLFVNR